MTAMQSMAEVCSSYNSSVVNNTFICRGRVAIVFTLSFNIVELRKYDLCSYLYYTYGGMLFHLSWNYFNPISTCTFICIITCWACECNFSCQYLAVIEFAILTLAYYFCAHHLYNSTCLKRCMFWSQLSSPSAVCCWRTLHAYWTVRQ